MHFIIDTTNLPPQTATEQFGPVSNTIYNVASKFSLTTATKAFAPVKGQIIVQQSTDAALVNVILKPMEANKSIPVKYFVFRGITKSSFIQGTDDIVPTGSELIQRFWTDYNNWLSKLTTAPPPPKVDVFGYDQNTIANTESIRSIFMNGHDVRPFVVQEGMWIGDFAAGATAGFEIILAESSYIPTLAYARATEYKVEITTQTGFEEKKKREEILNFIDPAAFYGLFYKKGVKINGTNTKVKKEQLYTDILSKFYTKNTIYLDIRNEEGYSYNFFENYDDGSGNNVEYSINGSSFTTVEYNNNWPILAINSTTTTSNNETDITIKLCTNDNPEPLIYHTDIVNTPSKKYGQFIGTDAIMNVGATWSKQLLFKAFNRQNGNAFQNVVTYCRINYFRKVAYEGSNKKIPKKTAFHHGLFGSIHHAAINQMSYGFNQISLGINKLVNGNIKDENFTQTIERNAIWDDEVIVFQAIKQDGHQTTKQYNHGKVFGYQSKIVLNNDTQNHHLSDAYFFSKKIDDNGNEVTLLELSHNGQLDNRPENQFLLGITQTEFTTLKTNSNLDDTSEAFINLESVTPDTGETKFKDVNGTEYYKYLLYLSGYDSNGEVKHLSTSTIQVFSLDSVTFTSKAFVERRVFFDSYIYCLDYYTIRYQNKLNPNEIM